MTPAEIQARVLYQDSVMMIIDKPAGLPVHAGPGGGANLEQYFDALRFGVSRPPGLAHRLDRDTSGCLVLGRHKKGLARLHKLFAEGRVEKVYWAVVEGRPVEPEGRIDLPLLKVAKGRGWRMAADPGGQTAVTDYRLLGIGGRLSWMEFRPRTGRTHQIRVHAASIGCPLLGDPSYGRESPPAVPMQLHARSISVPLYYEKPPVVAVAAPPAHMRAALAACGYRDGDLGAEATITL